MISAISTEAEEGQVPHIGGKVIIPLQHQLHMVHHRFIQVNYLATLLADQMVMVALVRRMIPDPPPAEVGLGYQAKPMEQLQRPVYGGNIEVRILLDHLGVDFLGADVIIAVRNGRQDHHALRRQPVALLAQTGKHIDRLFHTRRNTVC